MAEQLFFSRDTNVFLGVSTIKAVQVTAAGSSYETAPTVAFSSDAGGTGAAATATVVGGEVTAVTVTNPGSGYTSTPTIGFSGGGGTGAAAVTGAGIFEIPVLDGFSMSQSTNTTEVTLNEAADSAGVSRRGRQLFTDSYAPAEWSFASYIRPFKASGTVTGGGVDNANSKHHAVEEVLWAMMAGNGGYIAPVASGQQQLWPQAIDNTTGAYSIVDFEDSNTVEVGTFDLYFNLGESSTEVKTTALPSHTDASKISAGETVPANLLMTILALGTTSQAQWNTIFDSTGQTYTKGQSVTTPGTTSTFPANTTGALAPKQGASNGRVWLSNVTGIQPGDTVDITIFGYGGGTINGLEVLSVNPANSGGLEQEFVQLTTQPAAVPLGSTVTFSRRITYKVEGCCVNEASVDFDIDGIATINWSGLGKIITESGTPTATIYEGTTSTSNFIRNRLTTLAITAADETTFPGTGSGVYDTVITSGNITISNNLTFLAPETVGIVNQPLQHVTGTRSVSGSFTCYLNNEAGSSAELFEKIIENTNIVTNSFDLEFKVGGTVSNTPRAYFRMPTCHLEVPTHSLEDVIALEVNFHALPSSVTNTNELTLTYRGV